MVSVNEKDTVALGNTREVTAVASASVGNVAVGFNVLAHTISGLQDQVTVRRVDEGISVRQVTGVTDELPLDEEHNSASAAIRAMSDAYSLESGFELEIDKGIPLGSGLGGSAATAVAAVVAVNQMLKIPLQNAELFRFALFGETSAGGYPHGDNVAASLMGGLVINGPNAHPRPIQLPAPNRMRCVVIHPHIDARTEKKADSLPTQHPAELVIGQLTNLATFVSGCYQNDLDLIGGSLTDLLIEPHRSNMIPAFSHIKKTAMESGALGCSICGSGPSLFAWFASDNQANEAKVAMQDVLKRQGVTYSSWLTPINGTGAKIIA